MTKENSGLSNVRSNELLCWCELINPQPIWQKYLPGYPDKENSASIVNVNFCPECGSKLEST